MSQNEKVIVLNRMYSGDYLKVGNLGHEVINVYKSDNGYNYVYLQQRGSFHSNHKGKFNAMLLVRGIGNNTFMKNHQAYSSDTDFRMFTAALERQTVEYNNELYDEMNRLFAERLKQKK